MRTFLFLLLLVSLSAKGQLSCAGKITVNFSFTGGVQTWTVPSGITTITIKTMGASGGLAPGAANNAGGGAVIEADYTVIPGQVVTILVGGRGSNGNDAESGGGGATGVYINGVLKLVAGGGGGEDNTGDGGNGQAATSGSSTLNDNTGSAGCCADLANNGQGGTSGAGGKHGEFTCNSVCGHGGGGGGGLNSAGLDNGGNINSGRGGGQGNIAGAAGGLGAADDAVGVNGGWGWAGGGGADDRESGGGGGYSGGGGGPESFNPGGGGSFSHAVNRTASFTANGTNTTTAQDGIVTICYFSTLPLTLQSFSGTHYPNYNIIKWQTAYEYNLNMFIVERSIDGISFLGIGQVLPFNNSATHTYQFTDVNPGNTTRNYYRLRILENNSSWKYSPIINIKGDAESESFEIYPNPATDQLMINSDKPLRKLELLNLHGQVIYTSTTVNLTSPVPVKHLPKGIYLVKIYTATGTGIQKFRKD